MKNNKKNIFGFFRKIWKNVENVKNDENGSDIDENSQN